MSTKYENKPQLAEERFWTWVKSQNFPKGTPINFKPQDSDRTKAEIVDIGATLTAEQQLSLTTEFPELVGKEV